MSVGRFHVRVGCEFVYACDFPTPLVAMVEPKDEFDRQVLEERWDLSPELSARRGRDAFDNLTRRVVLPVGGSTLRYDALVNVSGEPDDTDFSVRQTLPDQLPDSVLIYTLPSRFCFSDRMADEAWRLFGTTEPGWQRVQAISDWVHANIGFSHEASGPMTTGEDTFHARVGVCRDFTHLAITFCRALAIPARYVFGYLPDIGIAEPYVPMDFSAWMEVYLGDRWWTFDPRNNQRRIAHIVVGRGRDAADVAMITSFGSPALQTMSVWAEQVTRPFHN